jgi:hypothetical protein
MGSYPHPEFPGKNPRVSKRHGSRTSERTKFQNPLPFALITYRRWSHQRGPFSRPHGSFPVREPGDHVSVGALQSACRAGAVPGTDRHACNGPGPAP